MIQIKINITKITIHIGRYVREILEFYQFNNVILVKEF